MGGVNFHFSTRTERIRPQDSTDKNYVVCGNTRCNRRILPKFIDNKWRCEYCGKEIDGFTQGEFERIFLHKEK